MQHQGKFNTFIYYCPCVFETFIANVRPTICIIDTFLAFFLFKISEDQLDSWHEEIVIEVYSINALLITNNKNSQKLLSYVKSEIAKCSA